MNGARSPHLGGTLVATLIATVLPLSIARADPLAPIEQPDLRPQRVVRLETTWVRMDARNEPELDVVASELVADWLIGGDVSGSIRVPTAHGRSSVGSATALGNVTVGARWAPTTENPRFVQRQGVAVSVSLPTAPTAGNAGGAARAAADGLVLRDIGRFRGGMTTAHIDLAWSIARSGMFLQVGGGADFVLDARDPDFSTYFAEQGGHRLRGGVAYGARVTEELGGMVELQAMLPRESQDTIHPEMAFGVRWDDGRYIACARAYLPFHAPYELGDVWGIGLDVGGRL